MKKTSFLFTALFSCITAALASPEQDSARIAGNLRTYNDQDWMKIAGEHGSERYEIARGDTLWDISGRLFGDTNVWPKIWEINNTTILNPHMIEPRMNLVFNSGSGLSLPSLVIGSALNNTGVSTVKNHYVVSKDDHPGAVWDEKTPFPSSEWRNLPRQSWENISGNLPPNIDKDGFDRRNRIYLRKPATGLEIPHLVACAPVNAVAKVEGTRSITTYVFRGSEITIRATGAPLDVNSVYSMLDPAPSEISTKGRKALSYDILGKVKILGLQSGVYVGEIKSTRETVMRGALLVPEIKRFERTQVVAGPSKVKGTILADRRTGAFMSGQHKWVYIDRGTRDGVTPGMLFRIFQNSDPHTNQPLTPGNVFVSGDAQVIQGCEDFSIGMFVWSRGEVPEQYEGELLTDLNDEKVRFYFNGEASNLKIQEPPSAALTAPSVIIDQPKPTPSEAVIGPGPLDNAEVLTPSIPPTVEQPKAPGEGEDWLDKLDNHQELQSDEENELKELEKFHETETAKAPPAEGADLPPPPAEDSVALPPAPPESAALPPAPNSEFPSTEPVVETPATLVKPRSTKSAAAPKMKPAAPPADAAPADENSVEGLPPL